MALVIKLVGARSAVCKTWSPVAAAAEELELLALDPPSLAAFKPSQAVVVLAAGVMAETAVGARLKDDGAAFKASPFTGTPAVADAVVGDTAPRRRRRRRVSKPWRPVRWYILLWYFNHGVCSSCTVCGSQPSSGGAPPPPL